MLLQVGFSSLLILTRMIYYAYYVLAPPLTGYNRLIGSFLMSFTTQLYYANYAKSFYIYTLSSQLFRSILFNRVKTFIYKLFGCDISNLPQISTVKTVRTLDQTL